MIVGVLVALRIHGGELMLEIGAAALQRVQVREGGERVVEHAGPAQPEDVLRQVPDPGAARQCHRSGVGLELASEDLQQRRLAGAVGTGEPDARTDRHAPAHLLEHHLRPVALAHAGERNHRTV